MINPVFSTYIIRELNASPFCVLFAMIMLQQGGTDPVTREDLIDVTGFGDHTVTDALRVLTNPRRQIAIRVNGGWRLAEAFQLPLYTDQEEKPQKREFRAFGADDVVVDEMVGTEYLFEDNNNNKIEKREIRAFEKQENDKNREIREFLHSVNIQEPMAGKLAKFPWVTKEYILAQIQAVKKGKWDNPEGMLVHMLQNKYPIPEILSNHIDPSQAAAAWTGHVEGCSCTDCQIIRSEGGRTDSMCPTCRHYHCECPEGGTS